MVRSITYFTNVYVIRKYDIMANRPLASISREGTSRVEAPLCPRELWLEPLFPLPPVELLVLEPLEPLSPLLTVVFPVPLSPLPFDGGAVEADPDPPVPSPEVPLLLTLPDGAAVEPPMAGVVMVVVVQFGRPFSHGRS